MVYFPGTASKADSNRAVPQTTQSEVKKKLYQSGFRNAKDEWKESEYKYFMKCE